MCLQKCRIYCGVLNSWVERHGEILRSWAAFVQLCLLPLTFVALVFAAGQFNNFISKADLFLEFSTPQSLTFSVRNMSSVVAQKPQWGFVLLDCDETLAAGHPVPIPMPWNEGSYIRKHGATGPFSVGKYGKTGHRYFGWARVFSENCKKVRTYWIYFIHGSKEGAWVSEMEGESEELYSYTDLSEKGLNERFPRRIRIN